MADMAEYFTNVFTHPQPLSILERGVMADMAAKIFSTFQIELFKFPL